MYKVKLLATYFSFIHSYINYSNLVWASTNRSKLDKLYKKQKHAIRIIYSEDIQTHSRPLMKNLKALNIYQINIFQILLFMYKLKNIT